MRTTASFWYTWHFVASFQLSPAFQRFREKGGGGGGLGLGLEGVGLLPEVYGVLSKEKVIQLLYRDKKFYINGA